MKIAILGWGSLIWDKRPDFDDRHGKWEPDGPELPLEFSRISTSRCRALTLVIDDVHGEDCTVAYTMSKRRDPDDAICDLRCREGTTLRRIGFWYADGSRSGQPDTPEAIKTWTKRKGFDVTIWTRLGGNFQHTPRENFISEAISHLRDLPPEGKAKAAEYVWRAPDFVHTPLRRELEVEPWFAAVLSSRK